MASNASISIDAIRAALGVEVGMKRMSQAERDRIENVLKLSWREEEYVRKSEENFVKELVQFFERWDLMLYIDSMSNEGKVEFIVGEFGNKSMYLRTGENYIKATEIALLPRINKRRDMFRKIPIEGIHIDDLKQIMSAITRVEPTSWNYVTDEEYKQLIEDLKAKYHL